MAFTIKGGTATTLEDFTKANANKSKSGGGSRYATRLPKEGETLTVRFLKPVEGNWIWYDQVWDQGIGRYVVITEENSEQYEDRPKSRRWLVPALDVAQNRVIALEIPKSLASQVQEVAANPRIGDITAGDFDLWKTGSGKDTEYHQAFLGKETLDLSKYDAPSVDALWKIVEEMVEGTGAGESTEVGSAIEADPDEVPEPEGYVDTPSTQPKKRIVIGKRG
jgi:hypothetical protein